MIILKQVVRYPDTNSVEATWVDQTSPEIEVPESRSTDTINQSTGAVIPGEVTPAYVIPAVEVSVKCHSYADVQMDMLRADLGDDADLHEDLISLVKSRIVQKTNTQLRKDELSALSSEFATDMQSMRDSWLSALIASDDETKAQIDLDIQDAQIQYAADRSAIIDKYL